MVRLEGYERRKPAPAVRRAAPAGRARARAREPAARPAARRAARRPRPQAARGDADRAHQIQQRGRHHVHLRDPRPGRGAHDERPHRGRSTAAGSSRSGRRPRSTSARRRRSSPGFVGTSNLLDGRGRRRDRRARRARSRCGRRRSSIDDAGTSPPDAASSIAAAGRDPDVVYLGPDTRYHVALDAGGELVVTAQNLATSSMEVLAPAGPAVRLVWNRQHTLAGRRPGVRSLEEEHTASAGSILTGGTADRSCPPVELGRRGPAPALPRAARRARRPARAASEPAASARRARRPRLAGGYGIKPPSRRPSHGRRPRRGRAQHHHLGRLRRGRAEPPRVRLGRRRSRSRPAARSTRRSTTRPTRWSR